MSLLGCETPSKVSKPSRPDVLVQKGTDISHLVCDETVFCKVPTMVLGTWSPLKTFQFCVLGQNRPSWISDQFWPGQGTCCGQGGAATVHRGNCLSRQSFWGAYAPQPTSEASALAARSKLSACCCMGPIYQAPLMERSSWKNHAPDTPHAQRGSLKLNSRSFKGTGEVHAPRDVALNTSTLMEVTVAGLFPEINQQPVLPANDSFCLSFLLNRPLVLAGTGMGGGEAGTFTPTLLSPGAEGISEHGRSSPGTQHPSLTSCL